MSKRRRRHPIPQEPVSAHIHGLSHEGRGIATLNEQTVFISNALPGETVEFVYTKLSKRTAEGKAITILNPSPERAPAKCTYFGVCGGCSLQHMAHDAQLQLKQNTLKDHLEHFAHCQPAQWLAPITGPLFAYRHKARLGVRYVPKKEAVLVGFREQQSRYLTLMESCDVLAEPVGQLILSLRDVIENLAVKSEIAQIEVAIGDTQCALLFRNLTELEDADRQQLIQYAKQHNLWIFLQPNKPAPLEKLWPNDQLHYLTYHLADYDLTYSFHPTDFTQVNPAINRQMIPLALKLLDVQPTDTVLDLFCGLGNFTLPLSQCAAQVIGVEGSNEMVERAKMNAEHNNIHNTDFYAADLTQPVEQEWVNKRYDKLLLDPPRSGALEILTWLNVWQPNKIVYVSCNPASLARDIGEITKYGYVLQQAGIMDMFPQTNHVESIALLERA